MSPESSVPINPPHKTLVFWISIRGKRALSPLPPLLTNLYYNTSLAQTQKGQGLFYKRRKKKTFWKLDLKAIFTFGLKYTRQTVDVELFREGIEVSCRGVLFHRVPSGGTNQSGQKLRGWSCGWQKGPPMPLMDWWTDWLTDWLTDWWAG